MMELDPQSHRILDLARTARTPSPEDKARVERRFALALGLTASAASAAASAQTASSLTAGKSVASAVVLKWWAGGGALLAAAFAGYTVLSGPTAPSPAVPAELPVSAVTTPAAPNTSQVDLQPAAAADVTGDGQAEPASRRTEPRRRAAAGPSLAAELELLHRAQSAWRAREAARALSIVDEHRARYPRSALRVEREALQVLALCELGRRSEAARVARALLAREPLSPLRAAIEQSCALK